MVRQKTMSHNQELVAIFDELYSLYMSLGEEFKAFAFFDVARLIETQYTNTPIKCGSELLMWRGVGQASVDIVNEYLSTGRCHRIDELRAALEALDEDEDEDEEEYDEEDEDEEDEEEEEEDEDEEDEEEDEEEYEEDEEEEEEDDFDDCLEQFWDDHLTKVDVLDNETPLEWVRATNLIYDEYEPYPKSALKKLGWFAYADKHFNKARSVIESLAPATLHFLAVELEKMQAGVPNEYTDFLCNKCLLAIEDQEECECDDVQTREYYKTLGVRFKN